MLIIVILSSIKTCIDNSTWLHLIIDISQDYLAIRIREEIQCLNRDGHINPILWKIQIFKISLISPRFRVDLFKMVKIALNRRLFFSKAILRSRRILLCNINTIKRESLIVNEVKSPAFTTSKIKDFLISIAFYAKVELEDSSVKTKNKWPNIGRVIVSPPLCVSSVIHLVTPSFLF